MQFKSVILSAFLGFGLVAADATEIPGLVAQLPSCGMQCLLTAVSSTSCGITDYECQCSNTAAITTAVDPCLQTNCDADEVTKVKSISAQICQALGASTSATGSTGVLSTAPSATTGSQSSSASSTGTASSSTVTPNAAGKIGALPWMGTAALLGAFAL